MHFLSGKKTEIQGSNLNPKEGRVPKNWCFWTVVLEKTQESLGLQGDQTIQSQRKSTLNIYWKDWYWSWSSNTLATWYKELTHWKRPWCWERLKAVGEGDDRGWDGWMASPTQWTWVWAKSRSWWRTGKPGVLQSIESQRVRCYWATALNWTWNLPYWTPTSYSFEKVVISICCIFPQKSIPMMKEGNLELRREVFCKAV